MALRPVHTYSIVAYDAETGQLGVAVHRIISVWGRLSRGPRRVWGPWPPNRSRRFRMGRWGWR